MGVSVIPDIYPSDSFFLESCSRQLVIRMVIGHSACSIRLESVARTERTGRNGKPRQEMPSEGEWSEFLVVVGFRFRFRFCRRRRRSTREASNHARCSAPKGESQQYQGEQEVEIEEKQQKSVFISCWNRFFVSERGHWRTRPVTWSSWKCLYLEHDDHVK